MTVLEAREIYSGYGQMEILHGVSIQVEEGEVVAIIGPNGAGKSTLMKAVFGLLPVTRGQVLLRGQEVTGCNPQEMVRRGVCYVPQSENVFPSLSVQENLEMGAFLRRNGLRQRIEEMYTLFPDLAARPRLRAGKLSGGQRQMLALARALMLDPEVLLLDEPTASLAPRAVGEIFARIQDINRRGVAVLLVEQNAKEALSFAGRGYVLVTGRNALEGPGQALLQDEEVGRLYLGR